MGNGVTGPGGPSSIPLGPDNFFENAQTSVKEGENLKTLAERLYVTEKELRDANPGIKEPLKKDQKISYPKNYMNDRSDVDHSAHTTHSKKKSKDGFDKNDGRRVNVSDEGVSAKLPKGGSVKVSPGGGGVYSPPKIRGVQPQVTVDGVIPGIPSKDDPIPDPSAARHIPNDPKDPKMVEIEKKQRKENTEASMKKYDTVEAQEKRKEELKEAIKLGNERLKQMRP